VPVVVATALVRDGRVLAARRARPPERPDAPEPRALEHLALRWVGPVEVGALDWVEADRAVVPDLVARLAERSRS
jgi:8-oxo-dGTP diphosphatase